MSPLFRRKVGFVPQMEMAECGAACLAMVLGHFGRHVPLGSLRVQCGVGRDGVTAEGLVRAAREHGLRALGVRVEQAQLRKLPCPLIVHWDFNHFIVIERFGRGGAHALDPALGRRWLSARELDESFTGVALVFEPGPEFQRRGRAPGALGPHLGALAAQRGGAAFLIGSAFMLQLLSVLAPGANQILIDHVLPPQRVSWLWTILGGLAAVGCARLLFAWLRGRSLLALYLALEVGLLSRLVAKLFALPCAFFDQRTPGDLLQRVRASSQLSQLSANLVLAALDLFMVLAVTGLMLAYEPRLGALASALSLLQIGCVFALRARTRQLASSELALRGRETSAAVDGLSIPEVARAFGLSRQLAVRHTNRVVRRVNVSRQLRLQTAAVSGGAVLLDGAARALLLYLGGLFVLEQRLSIGAFVGFLTLQSLLSTPLASLVEAASQVSYVKGLLSRMADVLDAESETSGELAPERLRGEIEVQGVCYRYGGSGPWVCDGIDLRIPAGQTVAIVGRSGAGKSTLAKLLVGLLQPTRGQIAIDGRPLADYALDALRRRIGVVLQEPVLFDASLRDNLDLAQQGLSDEALHAALDGACVRELANALPDGLDAQLGDCGGRVSGGQRQRLALARALAARPDILLLDEATSSLDPETEQRVQSALAARRCTRVVIAHRLRSVQQADRVLVMESGRVVQDGSYAALCSAAGPFVSLMGELA